MNSSSLDQADRNPSAVDFPRLLQDLRARTPARLLIGHAGPCLRTSTQLELRQDHAAARDAVQAELDLARDLGQSIDQFSLFIGQTRARSKEEFLRRPDLGRCLDEE